MHILLRFGTSLYKEAPFILLVIAVTVPPLNPSIPIVAVPFANPTAEVL
ncbi:hypothetical protein [Acinetobacter pittii]|nr:hypothetical protein [Acinetobacter pittii]QRQ11550.1 hypothetical protein I6J46_10060 [Acinetobacter pittii]